MDSTHWGYIYTAKNTQQLWVVRAQANWPRFVGLTLWGRVLKPAKGSQSPGSSPSRNGYTAIFRPVAPVDPGSETRFHGGRGTGREYCKVVFNFLFSSHVHGVAPYPIYCTLFKPCPKDRITHFFMAFSMALITTVSKRFPNINGFIFTTPLWD